MQIRHQRALPGLMQKQENGFNVAEQNRALKLMKQWYTTQDRESKNVNTNYLSINMISASDNPRIDVWPKTYVASQGEESTGNHDVG